MRIGILGASGFIGLQLIELLSNHPEVSELIPMSRQLAGKTLGSINPVFKHRDVKFKLPTDALLQSLDVLFMALPHGKSVEYIRCIESSDVAVIDLSADFRINDPILFEETHGQPHSAPDLLSAFTRICPDINGDAGKGKRFLSLPGCTASAAILSLYPLIVEKILSHSRVIVDAKVSSSGAGASSGPAQSHIFRVNGVRAYKLLRQHRHCQEIEAFIRELTGFKLNIVLNVFSVDMVRGISTTTFLETVAGVTNKLLQRIYRSHYGSRSFVRIIRQKSGFERYPNPRFLAGTNFCDIGFEVDNNAGHAVLVTAIDNLIRGGAGQAVQAFNFQNQFSPDTGLNSNIVFP